MMDGLTYFDSSALAKLALPQETGASLAASIFMDSRRRVTSMLSYAEAYSAFARRFRNRELDEAELRGARSRFDLIWTRLGVLSVEDAYVAQAAELALQFPLSGADALQLATARSTAAAADLTFVSWDKRQVRAAAALGFAVQPPVV